MKKILLIYPGANTKAPRFPMSCLVLASFIRKHGFQADIFDMRIHELNQLSLDDYFFAGISTMSGPQLFYALKIAEDLRKKNPSLPLVWGGIHPTLFPEQTAKDPLVDIVVRGEGEETLLEVATHISEGKRLDSIKGISFVEGTAYYNNPDREFIDLNKLELPAYDLLDIDKYADIIEGFSYETSRGCPYACAFCYVHAFHKRIWRCKSSAKVLNDIKTILATYSPPKIKIVEDLWLVDKKRIKRILQGFIDNKFKIKWDSFGRADFLSKCDDYDMQLLKDSGCEVISIGIESGSKEMLKKMKKKISVEQAYNATAKCVKYGIMPTVSFIVGMPGEKKEWVLETLDFYDRMLEFGNDIEVNGLFIYSPYPGTPMYEEAISLGYRPPTSLIEWANWKYNDINNTPWLSSSNKEELEVISILIRFKYLLHRMSFYSYEYQVKRLGNVALWFIYLLTAPIIKIFIDLRWKNRFFKYSIEWKIIRFIVEKQFYVR